jgi:hypothetical protein
LSLFSLSEGLEFPLFDGGTGALLQSQWEALVSPLPAPLPYHKEGRHKAGWGKSVAMGLSMVHSSKSLPTPLMSSPLPVQLQKGPNSEWRLEEEELIEKKSSDPNLHQPQISCLQ